MQVRGELASEDVEVLKLSALRGLFSAVDRGQVTFVNAPAIAAERGVTAEISTATESPNHRSVLDVRLVATTAPASTCRHPVGPQQVEKIVQDQRSQLRPARDGTTWSSTIDDSPAPWARSAPCSGAAGVNIQAAQLSEDAAGPGADDPAAVDRDIARRCPLRDQDRGSRQ